jgi:hypothetical protein
VRSQVIAVTDSKITLVEDVYTNETAYRAGFETFEVQFIKGAGAILTLKYAFHHALPPRSPMMELCTLYLQLCGRSYRMGSVAKFLRKEKKRRNEVSTNDAGDSWGEEVETVEAVEVGENTEAVGKVVWKVVSSRKGARETRSIDGASIHDEL